MKQTNKWGLSIVQQYGALILIAVVILVFSIATPAFLSFSNFSNILSSISIVTLLALGVTFSLIVDGLDVSIGSTASLATVVSAGLLLFQREELLLTLLIPLLIGVMIGWINGLLITKMRLQDLLVTLAMMYIINGIHLTYTKGSSLYEGMSGTTGSFIPSFLWIGQGKMWNIPASVIIMFVVILILHLFLEKTTYGRYFYFIGANKQAAALSGINVNRYRTYAYMVSGFLAALGGILLASRVGTGQVSAGAPLLMDSITAAFIGIALYGKGKPNVVGTFLGACLMGILLNGFTMLNVPYYAQDIIKGILLVLAIILAKRK